MSTNKRICELILALDVSSLEDAKKIIKSVGPQLKWVKVGLQMFTQYGPDVVRAIGDLGVQIFLDLKLYDIPNQVANTIRSLSKLPIGLLTLHTSGGEEMMRAAHEACLEKNHSMRLLGVTVLTSMDKGTLESIGVHQTPKDQVALLGKLAMKSRIHGLVCSPLEIEHLKKTIKNDLLLVTPGIRPRDSVADDQKRFMSPGEAAEAGSSYIVVGRPILKAIDPKLATAKILNSLNPTLVKHV